MEHQKWPSIPRLFRECIVTEKIDGTNAAIGFAPLHELMDEQDQITSGLSLTFNVSDGHRQGMWVQSRKRIITPDDDNFGFATWAADNYRALYELLGEGLHFGEWWGSGIQRGYGLPKGEKRFSLFNVNRWRGLGDTTHPLDPELAGTLACVPVLWEGNFGELMGYQGDHFSPLDNIVFELEHKGSVASPGFDNPEGLVIFHKAANHCFKYTPFDGDGHKGAGGKGQVGW